MQDLAKLKDLSKQHIKKFNTQHQPPKPLAELYLLLADDITYFLQKFGKSEKVVYEMFCLYASKSFYDFPASVKTYLKKENARERGIAEEYASDSPTFNIIASLFLILTEPDFLTNFDVASA